MSTLPNFPHKDQRSEKTKDGRGPENGNYDCVPVSFACAIQYYDGGYVTGDELKDAEYGEAYHSAGTSMARYVDNASDRARAIYHVTAVPLNGDPWTLVRIIHQEVDAGRPVVATIPSTWGHTRAQLGWNNPAAPGGWTHVIVFFSTGRGTLTAMNPWGGFDHVGSDQYWADRLCFNQVWSVRKEGSATQQQGVAVATMLNMDTTFFVASGTGWKAKATGQVIDHGMLDFYRANDGLFRLGLPLTGEMGQPWGGTIQVFERGALAFDPHGKYDRPWGQNGPIYFAHIDSGVVRDWLTADLQRQLAAANVAGQQAAKERDAAKAVAANAQSLIDSANKAAEDAKASAAQAQADLKTVSSELESVKAQLAQLQAQPPVPAPLSQEQKDGLAALDAVAKYMKEAH